MPAGGRETWGHDAVQATFARELITRRKRYPADLRDVLPRTYTVRQRADYAEQWVSEPQAARALRRARTFLAALHPQGGDDI